MSSYSVNGPNPLYSGMYHNSGAGYPMYAAGPDGEYGPSSFPGYSGVGQPPQAGAASSWQTSQSAPMGLQQLSANVDTQLQSPQTGFQNPSASANPWTTYHSRSADASSSTQAGSSTAGQQDAAASPSKAPTRNGGYPLTFTTDGRLAYIQPGDDLNNSKNIIYADQLPGQKGPNGENVYLTPQPDSKMIYIGKDDQKRDVIKYVDPAEQAKANEVYDAQALKAGIPGFEPTKDSEQVIEAQNTTLHEAVKKESSESLNEQDWKDIAAGKHDDILTTKIPDAQERLKVKMTAKYMVGQIAKAKQHIKDPIEALNILNSDDGDRLFKMADPGEKKKTRAMFEKIANGWTPDGLSKEDKVTFEKVRDAVRYTLCVNITDPKHFDEMKKHGAEGSTLFQYLDNSNSSKDNNGNFCYQNYGAALMHFNGDL